jgi:hypothetical protein
MKAINSPRQCAHRLTCRNYKKGSWFGHIFTILNDHACNYPHRFKPIDSNRLCSDPFHFPEDCPLQSVISI